MSVLEILTTTISSATSIPLLESTTLSLTPAPERVSEAEESPDSAVSTNPPSMFSTSMTPTRPGPTGHEEELITTDSPTIKEEHEDTDDVTAAPDFNVDDFASDNVTHVESAPHRGDTFSEPRRPTERPAFTESVATPFVQPDDQSIIEISTIQPDVPMPEASLGTEPMFAKGNTEETLLDDLITRAMASNVTDTPTGSTELTGEEVSSSTESHSTIWHQPTTPFPDDDEIETEFLIEALPPTPPPRRDLSDTQPGSEVEITTAKPQKTTSTATQSAPQRRDVETTAGVYKDEGTAASTGPVDVGTSSEDVTSPTSVHFFEAFTSQGPEHSGDLVSEVDPGTDTSSESFTSAPIASALAEQTATPGPVVAEDPSIQVTGIIQNVSGEPHQHFLFGNFVFSRNSSNSSAIQMLLRK